MMVTPIDPQFAAMLTLSIHDSVVNGLRVEGAIDGDSIDPDRLLAWADACANPTGQRAEMARGLAHLARVTPLRLAATSTERTFWDAVSKL